MHISIWNIFHTTIKTDKLKKKKKQECNELGLPLIFQNIFISHLGLPLSILEQKNKKKINKWKEEETNKKDLK